jgi:hypothetical protein
MNVAWAPQFLERLPVVSATIGTYVLEALALGVVAAFAFVAITYGLAVALTRGRFGWPGLRYFLEETLWVYLTQAYLPFGWIVRAKVGAPSKDGTPAEAARPIVLVHGYTQNRTNFLWLSRKLEGRGLGPLYGFDYPSLLPIEDCARRLAAFVERVRTATGAPEVDLVCHSLGGVVARTYVDLLGGCASVRRIITIGSPHRGLSHANLGIGASIRDLHPPTGFIAKLEGAAPVRRVALHSICSEHDNIVFPKSASSLGERGKDVVVTRHGHFGILFSHEVAEHVVRALTLAE